jgi:hypothetical protein
MLFEGLPKRCIRDDIEESLINVDMFLDQRPLEAREGDICFVDAPQSRNPDFLEQLLKIN